MRSFGIVAGAAVLLLFAYLLLASILSYWGVNAVPGGAVPDAWATPDSWSEWRDITIVMMGFMSVLILLTILVLLGVVVFLLLTIRKLLRDNVAPAVDSLKGTLDNARGTAEFVGETTVSPIIRVYSVINGVRGGLGRASSFTQHLRERRGRK